MGLPRYERFVLDTICGKELAEMVCIYLDIIGSDLRPLALLRAKALLRVLHIILSVIPGRFHYEPLHKRREAASLPSSGCLFKPPVRFSCPIC